MSVFPVGSAEIPTVSYKKQGSRRGPDQSGSALLGNYGKLSLQNRSKDPLFRKRFCLRIAQLLNNVRPLYQRLFESMPVGQTVGRLQKTEGMFAAQLFPVINCGVVRAGRPGTQPDIMVTESSAHWVGMKHCNNRWACPSCQAKVLFNMRRKLEALEVSARAKGLHSSMLTFTAPHHAGTDFELFAKQLYEARSMFYNDRAVQAFRERLGYRGLVQAVEIMAGGANGAHLHFHDLWFFDAPMDVALFKKTCLPVWERLLVKVGLLDPSDAAKVSAVRLRGLNVSEADASYLTKGSEKMAAFELTGSASKAGRSGESMPYMVLPSLQEKWADELFLRIVSTMRGRSLVKVDRKLATFLNLVDVDQPSEVTDEDQPGAVAPGAKLVGFHPTNHQLSFIRREDLWFELGDLAFLGATVNQLHQFLRDRGYRSKFETSLSSWRVLDAEGA